MPDVNRVSPEVVVRTLLPLPEPNKRHPRLEGTDVVQQRNTGLAVGWLE